MNKDIIIKKTLENELELLKKNYIRIKEEKNKLISENKQQIIENQELRLKLASILNSKSYKFATKISKILKRK